MKNWLSVLVTIALAACATTLSVQTQKGIDKDVIESAIKKGLELGYRPEYVDKENGNLLLVNQMRESGQRTIRVQNAGTKESPSYTVEFNHLSLVPLPSLGDSEAIANEIEKCCGANARP